MEDLLTLRNRAAVVVGAASAIGSATAQVLASVFLYLASDLAGFVNGAVVGVDGGLLL